MEMVLQSKQEPATEEVVLIRIILHRFSKKEV
jgi:hypothetical protein